MVTLLNGCDLSVSGRRIEGNYTVIAGFIPDEPGAIWSASLTTAGASA